MRGLAVILSMLVVAALVAMTHADGRRPAAHLPAPVSGESLLGGVPSEELTMTLRRYGYTQASLRLGNEAWEVAAINRDGLPVLVRFDSAGNIAEESSRR